MSAQTQLATLRSKASTKPVETLPPSDADRELALIGLALVEGASVVTEVAGIVRADDFTSPARVSAWRAIVEQAATHEQIDPWAVADAIAEHSDLDRPAARSLITGAHALPFLGPHAGVLAWEIAKVSARRRTIEKAGEIARSAFTTDLTPAEISDQVARAFADLDRRAAAAEDASFTRCLDALLEPRASGFPTGVDRLDEWTGGLVPGRYYVVSGLSGFGKTWLMCRMAIASATAGARVLFVSREMSKRDLFIRVAAGLRGASAFRLAQPVDRWTQEDHELALDVAREVDELPGTLDVSADAASIPEIGARVRAGAYDVAIIDYAQILDIPGDDYEQLKALEVWLIGLCKAGNVAVVIGSQLSNAHLRAGQDDDTSGHLGGGRLNNGASADIRLRRDTSSDEDDRVVIELRKHRHGPDARSGAKDTFYFDRATGSIRLASHPMRPQPERPTW